MVAQINKTELIMYNRLKCEDGSVRVFLIWGNKVTLYGGRAQNGVATKTKQHLSIKEE